MALKHKYGKREEIPAEQAGLYVEREGAWVLDVEKDTRLEEMRQSAIAANKERDALKARLEEADRETTAKLEAEKARLLDEQRLKEGKFAEVLADRVKAEKAAWEAGLAPRLTKLEAAERRLVELEIDSAVIVEATKLGLRASAVPDLKARARGSLRLMDGAVRVVEDDGTTVQVGADGKPKDLAEWVGSLGSSAPHFFEANAGGGAAGSGAGGSSGGSKAGGNPFSRSGGSWNLTEQMRLLKSDPGRAARLEAEAAGK